MVSCAFAATGRSEIANAALINRSFIFVVLSDAAPGLSSTPIEAARILLHSRSNPHALSDHYRRPVRIRHHGAKSLSPLSRCFTVMLDVETGYETVYQTLPD